jgi:hypothetical protein
MRDWSLQQKDRFAAEEILATQKVQKNSAPDGVRGVSIGQLSG